MGRCGSPARSSALVAVAPPGRGCRRCRCSMNRPQVSPPILIDGAQSRDAANVGVMAASLPPLRVVVDPERLLDIADIDPARIGMASTALPAEYFHCAVGLAVLAKTPHLPFADHLIAEPD